MNNEAENLADKNAEHWTGEIAELHRLENVGLSIASDPKHHCGSDGVFGFSRNAILVPHAPRRSVGRSRR